MSRQSKCSVCGKWYFNHNGMFIVLPDTYDDGKCKRCNQEIHKEAQEQKPDYNRYNLDPSRRRL